MLKFENGGRYSRKIYRDGISVPIGELCFTPGEPSGVAIRAFVTDYLTVDEMKECIAECEKETKK